VLNKVIRLGGVFGRKADHPLADPRQLRAVIAELPGDDAFRALDGISGWLESLAEADDFTPEALFSVACKLDDAAQAPLKRLSREYVQTPRLSRSEEKRLWEICRDFWKRLGAVYERCLPPPELTARPAEPLRSLLPAISVRQLCALGNLLKWEQFRYGPASGDLWARMGRALLAAGLVDATDRAVLAPGGGSTSPAQEYARAMILHAASPDSAAPLQIELMDRLITHFLPGFVFTAEATHDCVYWVDLASPLAPQRLARMPAEAVPTLRFFKPGAAHGALCELQEKLEHGGEIPSDIPLGGAFQARVLLPALRQLTTYLAPIPPQRCHERHRVQDRMGVVFGMEGVWAALVGQSDGGDRDIWLVENVSLGGFGATTGSFPDGRIRIGTLVAMQPEGGSNWLLGIVRRCHRNPDGGTQVGVEALSRRVTATRLKQLQRTGFSGHADLMALLLRDGNETGELRVVLPFAGFDMRSEVECILDGEPRRLAPVVLAEQTPDYEVVRYRLL
jgi:hypothetical protein